MNNNTNTLRQTIEKTLSWNNETWDDVIATTLTEYDLNYPHHWACNLSDFTLWTANRVYHVEHDADDGSYITSVDRNPPSDLIKLKG